MSAWTAEEDTLLKQYWRDGLSASQISGRMKGRTRNSVLGRLHRFPELAGGLPKRESTVRAPRVRTPRQPKAAKPPGALAGLVVRPQNGSSNHKVFAKPKLAVVTPVPYEPRGDKPGIIEIGGFGKECRWPIGDPCTEDFHFCGGKVTREGSPYCDHHRQEAYQPLQRSGKPFLDLQAKQRSTG